MRRMKLTVSSKIGFAEFAQAIKPQVIEEYVARIEKINEVGRETHLENEQ